MLPPAVVVRYSAAPPQVAAPGLTRPLRSRGGVRQSWPRALRPASSPSKALGQHPLFHIIFPSFICFSPGVIWFQIWGFRWIAPLVGRLSKLGPPGELAAALLTRLAGAGAARGGPEIPQAVGSINAVVGQAFFVPLYDLFLTYGVIFRLNFGPKVTLNLLEFASETQLGAFPRC